MRLKNRSVIITGGAQGLGEGIARRLASEGASVAIADRNGALAQEVADENRGKAWIVNHEAAVQSRGEVRERPEPPRRQRNRRGTVARLEHGANLRRVEQDAHGVGHQINP